MLILWRLAHLYLGEYEWKWFYIINFCVLKIVATLIFNGILECLGSKIPQSFGTQIYLYPFIQVLDGVLTELWENICLTNLKLFLLYLQAAQERFSDKNRPARSAFWQDFVGTTKVIIAAFCFSKDMPKKGAEDLKGSHRLKKIFDMFFGVPWWPRKRKRKIRNFF